MKYYLSPDKRIFAYESNGSQDRLIPSSYVAISEEQAKSLRDEQQKSQFNALSYADKRRLEYPSIGEQLDALYHAGLYPKDMADKIKAVKDKYQK